jgi:hypothetical protein
MIIAWDGEHCSDGCPFYEFNISVDGPKSEIYSPKCRLSGHRCRGEILDIRPVLVGEGLEKIANRPGNCPFNAP